MLEKIKNFLKGLSFRTGVVILLLCIPFYILSFAQMAFPFLSPQVKGVLWVCFSAWPKPANTAA